MTKKISIAAAVSAMFLAVLIFSGCATKPGIMGFPLIDIVDAEVDIDNSRFVEEDAEWVRSANTRIIGGTLKSKIVPRDLTINLDSASFQVPIPNKADLSEWFLNKPRGLTFTAHALDPDARYAAEKGATSIIVTVEGTPEQAINQPIRIRVPYRYTNRAWDFDVPENKDRRFEIYGVVVAPVVVGGAINRDIDRKDFEIGVAGAELTEALDQGTDVSSWFTNLPRGLQAVLTEDALPVSETTSETDSEKDSNKQQILKVSISGRASAQVNERMAIRIPANITTANIDLVVPPSDNAKYDIGSYSASVAENYELRNGSNWRGTVQGWGLTGPEVYRVKDFTAVGIIQITAESVYEIGEDGEYHWTGNAITYGDIMAEARRLDAHAIIDVVIDSKDQVNKTVEERHIEENHAPTLLELIKLGSGLIVRQVDPNGGFIYKETIEVTRRTWTGTALAIQYAPAYAPAVGDGRSTGYVPSVPAVPATR
jgi:hypothetical protein